MSVLVVEDAEPMINLVVSILKSHNFERIFRAKNGREGYDAFCKHKPDLVIADWEMTPMNGLELAQAIRSNKSPDRTVPIVMLTANNTKQHVEQARDVGVNEFLIKPFSAENLLQRIEYAIQNPRDFISTNVFFGPDRRRHKASNARRTEGFRRAADELLQPAEDFPKT